MPTDLRAVAGARKLRDWRRRQTRHGARASLCGDRLLKCVYAQCYLPAMPYPSQQLMMATRPLGCMVVRMCAADARHLAAWEGFCMPAESLLCLVLVLVCCAASVHQWVLACLLAVCYKLGVTAASQRKSTDCVHA